MGVRFLHPQYMELDSASEDDAAVTSEDVGAYLRDCMGIRVLTADEACGHLLQMQQKHGVAQLGHEKQLAHVQYMAAAHAAGQLSEATLCSLASGLQLLVGSQGRGSAAETVSCSTTTQLLFPPPPGSLCEEVLPELSAAGCLFVHEQYLQEVGMATGGKGSAAQLHGLLERYGGALLVCRTLAAHVMVAASWHAMAAAPAA